MEFVCFWFLPVIVCFVILFKGRTAGGWF